MSHKVHCMCMYIVHDSFSNLFAGTLFRRHRIPLPAPNDSLFYTVEDFNVDKDIVLHGRTFKITVRREMHLCTLYACRICTCSYTYCNNTCDQHLFCVSGL